MSMANPSGSPIRRTIHGSVPDPCSASPVTAARPTPAEETPRRTLRTPRSGVAPNYAEFPLPADKQKRGLLSPRCLLSLPPPLKKQRASDQIDTDAENGQPGAPSGREDPGDTSEQIDVPSSSDIPGRDAYVLKELLPLLEVEDNGTWWGERPGGLQDSLIPWMGASSRCKGNFDGEIDPKTAARIRTWNATKAELRTSHDTPKEAVAHFRAVRIECDQQPATGPTQFFAVKLGDTVAVHADDAGSPDGEWYCEVLELFQDSWGKRWFKCHWFYRPEDTTNRLDARVVRTERQNTRARKAKVREAKAKALAKTAQQKAKAAKQNGKATKSSARSGATKSASVKSAGRTGRTAEVEAADSEEDDEDAFVDAASEQSEEDGDEMLPYVPVMCENGRRDREVRRVWRASPDDNSGWNQLNSLDVIQRVVKCVQVTPGGPIPSEAEADIWWDQLHNRNHMTFLDPHDWVPTSVKQLKPGQKRVLNCLDLYCGAGGLAFLEEGSNADVAIVPKWAVDYDPSACFSFQANYPGSQVHCQGVDEFLWTIKKFAEESALYPESWKPSKSPSKCQAILRTRLRTLGQRAAKGVVKGQLIKSITADTCVLEFLVKWKGGGEEWVSRRHPRYEECRNQVGLWTQRARREGRYPLPGSVDVVTGGPPCQGMSGLNRHATTTSVLEDTRNRQVSAFFEIVEWLQPGYVVMENVMDSLSKQDGVYVKHATGTLLTLRYQTRTGTCMAGHHGVAQGRWRVLLVGAKSGAEQLPPFPEPDHRALPTACGGVGSRTPRNYQNCEVKFLSAASHVAAYPPVVLGDVIGDLPPIDNFTFMESQHYRPMDSPHQAYMRRDPGTGQATRAERASFADRAMAKVIESVEAPLLRYVKSAKRDRAQLAEVYREVGARYRNANDSLGVLLNGKSNMHNGETVQETISDLNAACKLKGDEFASLMCSSRNQADYEVGVQVVNGVKSAAQAREEDSAADAAGEALARRPLRDHRALVLNEDDRLRSAETPREIGANFRHVQGVIRWPDGTTCVGHTHAHDLSGAPGMCGGMANRRVLGKRSNHKESRVDHADQGGWRGAAMAGCDAGTKFLATGATAVPRWAVTYKMGRSDGRHGCFGRFSEGEITSTVVGRVEPHNLRLVHPHQDRTISMRENARAQGFPDAHVLVGLSGSNSDLFPTGEPITGGLRLPSWVRHHSLVTRFQQMGNAVSPPLAAALGRCLALAAVNRAPYGQAVVSVPDPIKKRCYEEARAQGLKFWMERQEGGEAGYTTRCKLERAHKMKAARERLAAWNAVMAQLGGPLSQASGKAQSASKLQPGTREHALAVQQAWAAAQAAGACAEALADTALSSEDIAAAEADTATDDDEDDAGAYD